MIKDLKFAQSRDILNLRADVGVLWDVGLHIDMPLVLSDVSSLDFDRSESDCIYPERTLPTTVVRLRQRARTRRFYATASSVRRSTDGRITSWGLDAAAQPAVHAPAAEA